jgi:hypothetical protein
MICPSKPFAASSRQHLVAETLDEIAAKEITVDLVDPEEEPRWHKLIRNPPRSPPLQRLAPSARRLDRGHRHRGDHRGQ